MIVGQRGVIVVAAVSGIALCLCGVQVGRWVGSPLEHPIVHLIPALLFGSAAGGGLFWLIRIYVTTMRRASNLLVDLKDHGLMIPADTKMPITTAMKVLYQALSGHIQQANQLTIESRNLHIQAQGIERDKELLEGVIQKIHDAVLVLDETGRVLLVNRSACRLFGFDKTKIIGQKPQFQLCPDKQAFLEDILSQRSPSEDLYKHEVVLNEQGSSKVYHCFVSRFNAQAQQAYGQVIVLRDVTRDKEVAHLKSDFVSYVSHELKTPLASITAYTEMLMDKEADNEATRQSFYAIILNQARRLNRLIEDILNISRIESGLIKVSKSSMSLTVILEEQLQMVRSYADEKNITLTDYHPVVHEQVYADMDMIRQVIINLLSNAIKYNRPGGSVTVQTEVDDIQGVVRVKISDTGVGIRTEEIHQVFERFYRAGDNAHNVEGTGLGLSLVKKIVEDLHQGRVFVTSQPGAGSTFGFELPLITQHDLQAV